MLGVLLLAALTLAPWHTGGPAPTHGGASGLTAIQAPDLAPGVGAAIAAAAAVAWLAAATLMTRPIVAHPGSALLVLWAVALGLALVKLITSFNHLAVGAWASVAIGAVLVATQVFGRQRVSVS